MAGMRTKAALAEMAPALTVLTGGRGHAPVDAGPVSAGLLHAALDAMAEGALFVGRGGRIVYANRAGRALLDDATVLRDVGGCIAATDSAQRGTLAAIIADAAATGAIGAASLVGHGGVRINLTAMPGEAGGPVLLRAAEVRRGEGHLIAQLQQAFGLTAAEADVARCLAAGDSSADIAQARGAAPGTVHCQIKAVAAKLGCRRRTEIAAIVQAMPRLARVEPAPVAALAVVG